MFVRRTVAAVAAVALVGAGTVALVPAASAASRPAATAASMGSTTITIPPAVVKLLTAQKIVPTVGAPGTAVAGASGLAITYPVTGLFAGGTKIAHKGTLTLTKGTSKLTVSALVVDTKAKTVTATILFPAKATLAVFSIDLSKAKVTTKTVGGVKYTVTSNVGVKVIDAAIAKALNDILGVKIFKAGLQIATAQVMTKA